MDPAFFFLLLSANIAGLFASFRLHFVRLSQTHTASLPFCEKRVAVVIVGVVAIDGKFILVGNARVTTII